MKKAKPTKGSARVRKFADGGDIAALAGLGTLAYLLSRKKNKEKEGGLKLPSDTTRKVDDSAPAVIKAGMSDAERRATEASMGRPELIPEGADRAVMESDRTAKAAPATTSKRVIAASKPAAQSVVKAAEPKPTPVTSKPNEERPSKPYPEKEAAAKKAAAAKGSGPKATFLTKERLDKSKEAMKRYREAQERKQRGVSDIQYDTMGNPIMKKGGAVKKYAAGGSVGSASKRADGIAQRGKTRGKVC